MALALFDIGVLWGLIIVLIGAFIRIEPLAGYIQLPYLAWVTFAAVLNYTLLKLNTEPVSEICCSACARHSLVLNSTHQHA